MGNAVRLLFVCALVGCVEYDFDLPHAKVSNGHYEFHCVKAILCGYDPEFQELLIYAEGNVCMTYAERDEDYDSWIADCTVEVQRLDTEEGKCRGSNGYPGGGECGWVCDRVSNITTCTP